MKFISSSFGELDVHDDKIIEFKEPIPGFNELSKYFIIFDDKDEENCLFCWLHSLEDGEVAFAMIDVFKILGDYQPEIDEEYLKKLEYSDGDTISVYNIVNIPDDIKDMTVNLIAPIVVNITKMKGMQVVLNSEAYGLKHRIFDELKKTSAQASQAEV